MAGSWWSLGLRVLLVCLLVGRLTRSVDNSTWFGLDPGMLSPLADLTIINGEVERDDLFFFQVVTEAWRSTRVRVSIADCSPHTAVIAALGAEPRPSRHDLLGHASVDDRSGTCGVDFITRPSYGRDGVWHFAIVGGSPLHGDRYFAGPPETLGFEITVIAEPVLHPWLDRGAAVKGERLRVSALSPVHIPTIPGQSLGGVLEGARVGDPPGGRDDEAFILPRVGAFVAGTRSPPAHEARDSSTPAVPPLWLGAFAVEAYHEVVTVEFELESTGKIPGGRHGLGEARAERPARAQSWSSPGDREDERDLAGFVGTGGDGTRAGDIEEARRFGWATEASMGSEACLATVCVASARVPPWGIDEGEESDAEETDTERRLCCSLELPSAAGNSTRGMLELPAYPQAGRWYLFARSSCGRGTRSPATRESHRLRQGTSTRDEDVQSVDGVHRRLGREDAGGDDGDDAGLTVISLQRDWANVRWRSDEEMVAEISENPEGGDGDEDGEERQGAGSRFEAPITFVVKAAAMTQSCPPGKVGVHGLGLPQQAGSPAKGSPGISKPESETESGSGLGSMVREEIPRGAVGSMDSSSPVHASCVGELFPTTMTPDGAVATYEGRGHGLSGVVSWAPGGRWRSSKSASASRAGAANAAVDEAGARGSRRGHLSGGYRDPPAPVPATDASAAGAVGRDEGASAQEEAYGPSESSWLWEGSNLPSVWYAVGTSGKEIGSSMTVQIAVNSSVPVMATGAPSSGAIGPHDDLDNGDDAGQASGLPSSTFDDVEALSLRVAMRIGGLPRVDANGTARDGTQVFWTADALIEPGAMVEPPPSTRHLVDPYPRSITASRDEDLWWSSTLTWNVTRPPAMSTPSSTIAGGGVGGGVNRAGAAAATTATTLFIMVSGEAIARGGGIGWERGVDRTYGDTGQASSMWAAEVAPEISFGYCDEETCPAGRGFCRARGGDSAVNGFVPFSGCFCVYGLAGESCAQRVVSYLSIAWKTFLLVGSNLAVVPGVLVALRLGAAVGSAPAVVLALNGAMSGLYHLCDLQVNCAAGFLSYHSLEALDFFFSFFSVIVLILHLCPMPWDQVLAVSAAGDGSIHPSGGGAGGDNAAQTEGAEIRPAAGSPSDAVSRTWDVDGHVHQRRSPPSRTPGWNTKEDKSGSVEEGEREEGAGCTVRGTVDPPPGTIRSFRAGDDGRTLDQAGSRLASLYVCLLPPLLTAVADHPTAAVNLALVFAICFGLLAFCWGRLILQDANQAVRGVARDEWQRLYGAASERHGQDSGSEQGARRRDGGNERLELLSDAGGEGTDDVVAASADEGGQPEGNVTGRAESALSEAGPAPGGDRDEVVGAERAMHKWLPLQRPPRRHVLAATPAEVWRGQADSRERPRRGGAGTTLRSSWRVLVESGLVDWRQASIGAAMFLSGLACFAIQDMPGFRRWYHIVHSTWHVLAMGSAVPVLRARRWGVGQSAQGASRVRRRSLSARGDGRSFESEEDLLPRVGGARYGFLFASRPWYRGRTMPPSYEMVPE